MKFTWKDKTALVTGASRGIGFAIIKEMLTRGANVIAASRSFDGPECAKLRDEYRGRLKFIPIDISKRKSISEFARQLQHDRQEIEFLVNNAGQLTGGLLEDQPIEDIYSMLQVNLLGVIHLTHDLLPSFVKRDSGWIVNNASVSGILHFPGASTYSASKAGVIAFTNALNQELAKTNVNTLLLLTPGVDTHMFRDIPKFFARHTDLSFVKADLKPQDWAHQICDAMEKGKKILNPKGFSRVSIEVAKHFPIFFEGVISTKFKR